VLIGGAFTSLPDARVTPDGPAWTRALSLPWINPRTSPTGDAVAVERMTPNGTDLFVISGDARDTTAIFVGGGHDIAMDWAPDGHALLVARARPATEEYDADLFVVGRRGSPSVPIDTNAQRAVTEAAWSPDGTRIAWVARVSPTFQQEVFIAYADGSGVRNLSGHPSEDYHIAWSADGSLLAFTSERSGHAELYAVELLGEKRFQLTFDSSQVDRARFSPDGRWIAFESTRGGEPAVYVMPALGGQSRRVSPVGQRLSIAEWRGTRPTYIDRITVDAPAAIGPGDTATLVARVVDAQNREVTGPTVEWRVLDEPIAVLVAGDATAGPVGVRLAALRTGVARVRVSVGEWRVDTVEVHVGTSAIAVLNDDFEEPELAPRWRVLGIPAPALRRAVGRAGSTGVVLNADQEWDSGLLSTSAIALRPGVGVSVWAHGPFAAGTLTSRRFTIALVSPQEATRAAAAATAPELSALASVTWHGDAGRIAYAVEREVFTVPVSALGTAASHTFGMAIENDGRVAFLVDGVVRHRSTLRVVDGAADGRAHVWIAGRGTGDQVAIDAVSVTLAADVAGRRNP
jgi:hypothetical protein